MSVGIVNCSWANMKPNMPFRSGPAAGLFEPSLSFSVAALAWAPAACIPNSQSSSISTRVGAVVAQRLHRLSRTAPLNQVRTNAAWDHLKPGSQDNAIANDRPDPTVPAGTDASGHVVWLNQMMPMFREDVVSREVLIGDGEEHESSVPLGDNLPMASGRVSTAANDKIECQRDR